MSNDPNYKATLVILNDIEAHGLVQFNPQYYDEDFFKNFLEFEKAFSNSIHELVGKLDTFQNIHDDMVVFTIYSELCYINSHLDMITKFLKIIINSTLVKGGFDENTQLHQMITKICNKMQYTEKLKNSIRGLFLIDFKNAITNQHYLIYKNGTLAIYPNDEKFKKYLNIKDLTDNALQTMAIFDAMYDWANGTSKDKPGSLSNVVKNLINQVEELDKKLDRLKSSH
ncbi:MAG: hypothetical protein ACE5R7_06250 [Nitrosarchaeum sp.]